MPYEVELAPWVEEAPEELSEDDQWEVMESIAAVLARRDARPAPGGWAVTLFGQSWWITFAAYCDGIWILDLGRLGEAGCTRWADDARETGSLVRNAAPDTCAPCRL